MARFELTVAGYRDGGKRDAFLCDISAGVGVNTSDEGAVVTLDELERKYVHRVLALAGGNKSRVAQLLGIDRRTLYRKLAAWGEGVAAPR